MSSTELIAFVIAIVGFPIGIAGAWGPISALFERVLPNAPEFKVRRTTIKALISESETEVIKLRTIRILQKRPRLAFPDVPEVLPTPSVPYGPAPKIKDLWALPGRAQIEPNGNVLVLLQDDEAFRPLTDYTLVTGYTMSGAVTALWGPDPPFLEAKPPTGSERLVIEVYFPPGWQIKLGTDGAPLIPCAYARDGQKQLPLPERSTSVKVFPPYDFFDGRGPVQWVRAVIRNPPQKGTKHVVLKWQWERMAGAPQSPV